MLKKILSYGAIAGIIVGLPMFLMTVSLKGHPPAPWGMVISNGGDSLYVANSGGTNISVLRLSNAGDGNDLVEDVPRRLLTPNVVLWRTPAIASSQAPRSAMAIVCASSANLPRSASSSRATSACASSAAPADAFSRCSVDSNRAIASL